MYRLATNSAAKAAPTPAAKRRKTSFSSSESPDDLKMSPLVVLTLGDTAVKTKATSEMMASRTMCRTSLTGPRKRQKEACWASECSNSRVRGVAGATSWASCSWV